MTLRRWVRIAVPAVGLVAPLSVAAQTGTVRVAPLGTAAPAMSFALLGLLTVALAVTAALYLRRSSRTLGAGLVLATAAIMLASAGYAILTGNIIISGDECDQQTMKVYEAAGNPTLESQCANPIRIVDTSLSCSPGDSEIAHEPGPVPSCDINLVLNSGDSCRLRTCCPT